MAPRSEFAFIDELCRAIESYTAAAVRDDEAAFYYRGANLRYAVERALYFRSLIDRGPFDRFMNADGVVHLPLNGHRTSHAAVIAAVRERGALEYRRLRRAAAHLREGADGFVRSPAAAVRPDVLVHVIHEKFITYLQPVLARLSASYAYLAALNPGFLAVLERRDMPWIDATAGHPEAPRVPASLKAHSDLPAWYDRLHRVLSSLRPKTVVLVEGNAPQDEVIQRVCHELGIRTVCIQHGWSPVVHNGFRNMTYSRMAVWGEGFAEMLRPFNPDQVFAVTGHHDIAAQGRERNAIGFFLQSPGILISADAWRQFLDLIRRVAERLPQTRVLIREHPSRPLDDSERRLLSRSNVEIAPPASQSLSSLLAEVGVVVSIYSTVLLEGLAAGAVPVVVNLTSLPSYSPDLSSAGAAIEVKDLEEAVLAVVRLVTDRAYREAFAGPMDQVRRRFFAPSESAADRLSDLIANTVGR